MTHACPAGQKTGGAFQTRLKKPARFYFGIVVTPDVANGSTFLDVANSTGAPARPPAGDGEGPTVFQESPFQPQSQRLRSTANSCSTQERPAVPNIVRSLYGWTGGGGGGPNLYRGPLNNIKAVDAPGTRREQVFIFLRSCCERRVILNTATTCGGSR